MIDVKVTFADASHISLKDAVTIAQGVVTLIAILVGGLWTYFLFVKKRQKYPHASISHQIFYRPLSKDKALLNVKTLISNSGDVLLCLKSGLVRVQQILPMPDNIDALIGQGQDPVDEHRTEVDWLLIGARSFSWETGKCEIEPGEKDQFISDHVIDSTVQLVAVYSYFENTKKRGREIGWNTTTIYEVGHHRDQINKKGGDTEDE